MTDVAIPLGLGTGKVDDRDACIDMVTSALDAGYRHVDTAQGYENEAYVGTALDRAAVDRDTVVLGTKVLQHDLSYEDVHATVERSLDRLGVDRVDVLYVHWPTHDYDPEETLAAFDELHDQGIASHLGVCNFTYQQLEQARRVLEAPLSVFQIEHHPLFRPTGLIDYCKRHDISVVGYSPLANGRAVDHPTIQAVAADRDATPAQVCLAWSLAHDVTPIPRGSGDHIEENLEATELELTPAEIDRIDEIEVTTRVYDPDWAPWN